MEESPEASRRRRKGDRRKLADRRSGGDRRLVDERRLAQRRKKSVPVDVERRSGVERRARILSSLSVRDHIIVHALRRLIGRLYQISQSRPRSEKISASLGEARAEILKLDPNLYTVAATMGKLKNTPIAKLEEYEHSREMLERFNAPRTSGASAAKQTRRAPAGRKATGAKGTAAGARKSTVKKTSSKTTKKTAVKKAAKRPSRRKTGA